MKNKRKITELAPRKTSTLHVHWSGVIICLLLTLAVTPLRLTAATSGEDFFDADFPIFQQLDKLEQQGKTNYKAKQLAPLYKDVHHKSHKFEAALTRGSIVEDQNGNKFRIKKQIYIMALINDSDPYTTFIINKAGVVQYRTHTKNVISIRRDVNIGVTPSKYTTYNKVQYEALKDSQFVIDNTITAGANATDFPLAKSIAPEADQTALGYGIEARTYFPWKFPVSFGLALGYKQADEPSQKSFVLKNLYLGPSLKYTLPKMGNHEIAASLTVGRSLLFTARFSEEEYELREKFVQFNLEDSYQTVLGSLVLGASYNYGKIDAQDLPGGSNGDSERGVQTLSIYIGKDFDISL